MNKMYPNPIFNEKKWFLQGQYSVLELILIILEIVKHKT